jgi:hypothetical protein
MANTATRELNNSLKTMPLSLAVAVLNLSSSFSTHSKLFGGDYSFRLVDLAQELFAGTDVFVYQP